MRAILRGFGVDNRLSISATARVSLSRSACPRTRPGCDPGQSDRPPLNELPIPANVPAPGDVTNSTAVRWPAHSPEPGQFAPLPPRPLTTRYSAYSCCS